uniref:TIGR02099 family protein n=1 Tax=Candidatus Kentrum sp. LFY TaxID=2126342 RepID=A0A450ULE9_9GAMM|nr:MAG: TIGR02099 family protein [Candidatus Kentron sp. LFY]
MGNDSSQGASRLFDRRKKAISHPDKTSARDRWSVFLLIVQIVIVLVTCLLIALRLSLPSVGKFRSEVEQWFSAATGQSVSIGSLDATWHGWTPELVIKDIRLSDAAEGAAHIQSLRARIGLDPFAFWKPAGVRIKKISLSEVTLAIVRDPTGSLRLAGIGPFSSSTEAETRELLSWLLRQPRVDVESASIRWRDEQNDDASFFMTNIHLGIRRSGSRHRIRMAIRPSEDATLDVPRLEPVVGSLSGMADITVNPATLDWSGSAFFQVEGFDLDRFEVLQDGLTSLTIPGAVSGIANFGFWTFWNKGQLEHVEGNFALRDLILRGMNSNITVHQRHVALPERGDQGISVHGGNRTPLVGEYDELSKEHDCTSCAPTDEKTLFPGANGYLQLRRIGADNWQLQLHEFLLATPLGEWPVTRARFEIAWLPNHHGLLFTIRDAELENEDIILRLMGAGQWFEDHSSPDLRFIAEIEHGRLDGFHRYLPTNLMGDSLVQWLRHAFPKGELREGRILFHGRIADFPFDNGKGVFEVRARTSHETILDHAESWPPIEKLKADIVFGGRGVTITANSGFVYGGKIEKVIAEIPDILAETPILSIHGRVVGGLDKGLAFLRHGPLADRYAHRIAGISGTGRHRLDLKIQLPLGGTAPVRTRGSITFLDNVLDVNIPWATASETHDSHITFDGIGGVLTFDEHGIAGKSIAARYLDRPITFDIAKATDSKNTTRFTIEGIDTDTLLAYPLLKAAVRKMSPSLLDLTMRVTHKATWRIMLDLSDDWGRGKRLIRLRIISHLRGATVDLPSPLTGRPFRVEMLLGGGSRENQEKSKQHIRFRFGSRVTGVLSPGRPGGNRKWRGAVRLGAGPVTLPRRGIRIDGHIPRLSLDEWRALLAGLDQSTSGTRRSTQLSFLDGMPNIQAEISSDQFTAFSRVLRNTEFKLDRGNRGVWHIQVRSDAVQGHIRIPRPGVNQTVAVALTRLQLPLADGGEREDFDPGNIPPIRLTCENLIYDALPLGRVDMLELSPNPQGLRIQNIKVTSENFRIRGHGMWKYLAQSNQSEFHIETSGPDLGKLLSSFGYEGDVAKGGETELKLSDARWPGSPTQFALDRMTGTLDVKITNGRLLAIEPGATGRVFGLLSITLLPRRLLLDFRDIFQEGLVYDRMEGKFSIHGGNAETNDFFVEGPTSRIDIQGNTGLVRKDYNQVATVVPKLASSIPLAAVGIMQKLFDSPFFDKVFTYQYTIRGTWDDPRIESLESHTEEESRITDDGALRE